MRGKPNKKTSSGAIFLIVGAAVGIFISVVISLPLIFSGPKSLISNAAYSSCQDRIVEAGEGWYWKAHCEQVCTDPQHHSDCPENPEDPDPKTSNWCYLFKEGLRCMQRIKEEGGEAPAQQQQTQNPNSNGECFSLTADTYADKDGDGWKFNTHVLVHSPEGGGDGHIQLFVNGNSKGWNQGWNKSVNNPFVILPQYTDTPRLTTGTTSMNYKIKIDECADRGNTHDITCSFGVRNGMPTVSGTGCFCKTGNCIDPGEDIPQPPPQSSSSLSSQSSSKKSTQSSSSLATQTSSKKSAQSSSAKIYLPIVINGSASSSSSVASPGKIHLPIILNQTDPTPTNIPVPSNTPVAPTASPQCVWEKCATPNDQVTVWKKGDWYYPDVWNCQIGSNKIAPYGVVSYCSGQPRTVGVSIYLWMRKQIQIQKFSTSYVEFGWENGGWIQAKRWTIPQSAFQSDMYTVADNAPLTLPVYCPTCIYKARLCFLKQGDGAYTCINSGGVSYASSMLIGLDVN